MWFFTDTFSEYIFGTNLKSLHVGSIDDIFIRDIVCESLLNIDIVRINDAHFLLELRVDAGILVYGDYLSGQNNLKVEMPES